MAMELQSASRYQVARPWVSRERPSVPWNRKGRISEAAVSSGPGMGHLWQLKGGIEEEDVLAGWGVGYAWGTSAHVCGCTYIHADVCIHSTCVCARCLYIGVEIYIEVN